MSKQRSIDELRGALTLVPSLDGALGSSNDAEILRGRTLPESSTRGVTWHAGRTVAGVNVLACVARADAAADVADAARRAQFASVEGVVPVSEVGEFFEADGTPVTIVLYPDPQLPTLADLTREGPLRPETARAVAGQVATALDACRRRGIRHRALDEHRVFVDVAGDAVFVLGVGVEYAAIEDGAEKVPPRVEPDARALGLVLFVALTGRRPEFFATPPVADPAEVSPRSVPEDLSRLTRELLREDDAEEDLAGEAYAVRTVLAGLGRWQSIPVTLEAFDPDQNAPAPRPLGDVRAEDERHPAAEPEDAADAEAEEEAEQPVASAPGASSLGTGDAAAAATVAGAVSAGGLASILPGASARGEDSEQPEVPVAADAPARGGDSSWSHMLGTGEIPAAQEHDKRIPAAPIPVKGRTRSLFDTSLAGAAGAAGAGAAAASSHGTTGPETASEPPARDAASENLQRPAMAPPSATPAVTSANSAPFAIPVKGRSESALGQERMQSSSALRDVLGVAMGTDDATGSHSVRSSERRNTQSTLIVLGVLVALILAFVIAITAISSVGRNRDVESNPTTATSTPAEKPSAAASSAPAPKAPAPAAPAQAAAITEASIVYPPDQAKADYPDKAGALTDKNPETAWKSKRYKTPQFGGLRDGMGIHLKIGEGQVNKVIVTPGKQQGGDIELRTVGPDNAISPEPIAKGTLQAGADTVLTLDKPVDARDLVLWAPTAGAVEGGYRVEIAEVSVALEK